MATASNVLDFGVPSQISSNVVPAHDAILPVMFNGVKWGVPNLGDNVESNNLALVRLFEKTGEYVQAMSIKTDCFSYGPPTIGFVKLAHNCFVRLNAMIDASTKLGGQERLEAAHVTHERRKFKVYPTRYYDVKNDYCRRYIELCLFGLSNMAQMSENTWENDWSVQTAKELKKLFREFYRLMCIELFGKTIIEAAKVFDDTTPYFLTEADFTAYNPQIPEIEWIRQPAMGSFFTEDELRPIATPNVDVGTGVPENDKESADRTAEQQIQNSPQIIN